MVAIGKYRQKRRNIYSFDETLFDIVWTDWNDNSDQRKLDLPLSKGNKVIILCSVSVNGWVEVAVLLSAKNIKTCSLEYPEDIPSDMWKLVWKYVQAKVTEK